jgi:hypothetical protein
MTDDTGTEPLTEEELEDQDAEQLPDREAMSIITPGFERPVPLDGIPGDDGGDAGGPTTQ